jgi:zinc transport system substrate-binding protein
MSIRLTAISLGLTIIPIMRETGSMQKRLIAGSLALLLAAPLAACGSESGSSSSTGGGSGDTIEVAAAFYPLQWIAEQVGGDDVSVSSLTPAGAEPHDLELTPKQVAQIGETDVLLKLSGFQPAVDDAAPDGDQVLDVADVVDLDLTTSEHDHDHEGEEGHSDEEEEAHAEEEGAHADEEEGHDDEKVADPHFWLDPTMLAEVAPALAERFGELDPDNAAAYQERADETVALLEGIDEDFTAGLADCESTDLVTSHEAFGYLARRYDLTQVGINGLSAEQEPSPARLAEVTDFVNDNDVRTIYFETLVPSDIAQTIADETGAETAVLDPLEGLTDESAGDDYPSVMAANLEALRAGQPCT